jgi:hypothetical protein
LQHTEGNTEMVEYYPQWLAGQDITADQLNLMLPMVARKVTDTARTSTGTATADPELTFTLAANAVYIMDGWIKYSADASGDLLIDWNVPSGCLGEWSGIAIGLGTSASTTSGYSLRTETNDIDQARSFAGIGAANTVSLQIYGTIRTSSGGTYAMTWAQGASFATATTLYTDSWLRLQRVA